MSEEMAEQIERSAFGDGEKRVSVNDFLQTANPDINAAGSGHPRQDLHHPDA